MTDLYDVHAYGAVGDGLADDGAAIQRAIDACAASGGGTVLLSGGGTFESGSLCLKKQVELRVEKGSVLRASKDLTRYYRPCAQDADRVPAGNPLMGKPAYAFLYGFEADGCAITGGGVIDGNGGAFIKRISPYYATGDFYPRPTMIYLEKCSHISVTDVTMRNAPFWTLHPAGCDDVRIAGIRILNPLDWANSDGIDPDHCRNVRISDCHIVCADDCICLKNTRGNAAYGPTENIIITGCTLTSTSSAVKIGTEGVDDFRNILVSDCAISRSNRGLSIQIRDGGHVENVTFSNCTIETRRFSPDWWGCGEPVAVTCLNREPGVQAGSVRNLRFFNLTCLSENGVLLYGTPENPIEDVTFEHLRITVEKRSKWACGAYDLRPGEGPAFAEEGTSAIFVRYANHITLEKTQVQWRGEPDEACRFALDAAHVLGLRMHEFHGAGARPQYPPIQLNDTFTL